MSNTSDYRQQLDQIETQMRPNDRKYFQDLQLYLLTKNLVRSDEQALTLELLTMGQDFLDASQHGETATEFFGNEPVALANALLAELPRSTRWQQLQFIGILVLISWFFLLLGAGTTTGLQINWLLLILVPFIEIMAIELIFKIMNHHVYDAQPHSTLQYVLVSGVTLATIALIVGLTISVPHFAPWSVSLLPNPWGILVQICQLIICLGLLGFVLIKKRRRQ